MSVDDDEDQALPANHRNKRYVLYQLRSDKAILEDIRLDRVPNPNLNESAGQSLFPILDLPETTFQRRQGGFKGDDGIENRKSDCPE